MAGSCLCNTKYALFSVDKTYEWRELKQGTAWAAVTQEFEKWAVDLSNEIKNDKNLNYNKTEKRRITCRAQNSRTGSEIHDCIFYNERETTVKFELVPSPGKSKPQNVKTPPDEKGTLQGPFDSNPPGDKWDKDPYSYQSRQTVSECPDDCIIANGGNLAGTECEDLKWKEPHINTHFEKVKTKFVAYLTSKMKLGLDDQCCPFDPYLPRMNGWVSIPMNNRTKNGPEIELPFGLFQGEKTCMHTYNREHVCF